MVIDPHVTEFERIDDAQCTADVTGPNRCRQAILDVVGECDRVGLVIELLNGGYWAEDLLPDQLVALRETTDNGRLVVVALPLRLTAANKHFGGFRSPVYQSTYPR
jgi:hypothetical protein